MPARRRRAPGVGQTIGGILVGFDGQVWRRLPPAQERVVAHDRALRVSVPGGLVIELPRDRPLDDGPPGIGRGPRSEAASGHPNDD